MKPNHSPLTKWNTGPVTHVRAGVTRVCALWLRRALRVRPHMDRVEFERRLAACVARAEAEAAAVDRLLAVRAR